MDAEGHVIYMGTFSKAIAPAIRVGYLVLPDKLLEKYQRQARFYSSTVSRVDQKILADFIKGGYFERHLNRMREIYKGKHDTLLAALKPLEDQFEIKGEFAGLHVLLKSKGNVTEQYLVDRAKMAGVKVYGLSDFSIEKAVKLEEQTVLLGYARLDEEKLQRGANILCRVYGSMEQNG